MSSINIKQNYQLISSKKTIEWLVNKTDVAVFDAVKFDGYQRKIDTSHCEAIVKYLESNFLLPTAIICACSEYDDECRLRIVDGQHRVAAFRLLSSKNPERYDQIKDMELPVIIIVGAPVAVEIDTFIKINKTSKKVDTSLAFVLKNKLSCTETDNFAMSKSEYISVEIAKFMNDDENNDIWYNKILFEGNVKKSTSYISLNSFVKATRVLVNILNRMKLINLKWSTNDDVQETKESMIQLLCFIWMEVYNKWPSMLNASLEEKQIIQGSIGYTSIIRFVVMMIKDRQFKNIDEFKIYISDIFSRISIDDSKWKKGSEFSKYSSESGIRIVSAKLQESISKS